MTYPEFLIALQEVAKTRKFELKNSPVVKNAIRTLEGQRYTCDCPIVAVSRPLGFTGLGADGYAAGRLLGLSSGVVSDIIDAADLRYGALEHVRRDLLEACGLQNGEVVPDGSD